MIDECEILIYGEELSICDNVICGWTRRAVSEGIAMDLLQFVWNFHQMKTRANANAHGRMSSGGRA